jgi:toxin ParE1/3/4
MPRLRYSAESKDDLKEIARFIAKDKPVAARQCVSRIREKCRIVAKHLEIEDD